MRRIGAQRGRVQRGLLAVTLAAGLLGVGATPAPAQTASISGNVFAAVGGADIGNFQVELQSTPGGAALATTCSSVVADHEGEYSFTGLAAGDYYVYFSNRGTMCTPRGDYAAEYWANKYEAANATKIALVAAEAKTGIDGSIAAGSHIEGTVTEGGGGPALQNVTVEIYDVNETLIYDKQCTSAGTGAYRSGPLPALQYTVKFNPKGTCGDAGSYAVQYYNLAETLPDAAIVTPAENGGVASGINGALTPPVAGFFLTVQFNGTGAGTVTSDPAGINCVKSCAERFIGGDVTLTATPAQGSTFTGWGGSGCSGTGTCTVTIDTTKTVTATFTASGDPGAGKHSLTIAKSGSGGGTVSSAPAGIDCGATCSTAFDSGTQIKLTAVAVSGSTFGGWIGGGCPVAGECTVTLNADTTVVAVFTQDQGTVPDPPGGGDGGGGGGGTSPPGGSPSPGGITPPGFVPRPMSCRLAVKSTRVGRPGRVTLTATCDQAGTLTLSGSVKIGRKTYRFKSGRSTAIAGRARTIALKLPAAALRAVRARKRASATFTLLAGNANGQSKTTAKAARLRR